MGASSGDRRQASASPALRCGGSPSEGSLPRTRRHHMGGPSPLVQENLPEDLLGPKAVSLRP